MAELIEFIGASVEGTDEDKVYTPRGIQTLDDRVRMAAIEKPFFKDLK